MKSKIDITLDYYNNKRQEILETVNSKKDLSADQIIYFGREMEILEFKITALEVAKEN